eukprot:1075584-Amorphochlora_amoeboformis.AAC.1
MARAEQIERDLGGNSCSSPDTKSDFTSLGLRSNVHTGDEAQVRGILAALGVGFSSSAGCSARPGMIVCTCVQCQYGCSVYALGQNSNQAYFESLRDSKRQHPTLEELCEFE